MDYGIRGRKAIVCAASQGLGKGCAMALAREGVDLVINARGAGTLDATAEEIRARPASRSTAVAADITTAAGRAAVLAACPAPDILVNNAGGPPIGDFRDWDEAAWQSAVNANMIDADHADPRRRRRHDRAPVRAHRQHHVALGQGAARAPRAVEWRARRA